MLPSRRNYSPPRHAQRGVALWLVLVLSMITSLLVLSQTTGVMRQFNISRNERDMAIAMQAAEAALRDAEADVQCQGWTQPAQGQTPTPKPTLSVMRLDTTNNVQPHCMTQRVPTCTELMPTQTAVGMRRLGRNPGVTPTAIDWNTSLDKCTSDNCPVQIGTHTAPTNNTTLLVVSGVAQQPRYHVDVLDVITEGTNDTVPLFRITARGYGLSTSTVVTLQSVFRPKC